VKNQKLEAITPNTLIVGVDIAKAVQWARFCGLSRFGNREGVAVSKTTKQALKIF